MNTYTRQTIDNWKRNLILFLIIPIVLIGCIYINYGEIIDAIIAQQHITSGFFQLKTHLSFFQKEITPVPIMSLPIVVSTIGYYSVIFIYFLFLCWLILFAFSAYVKMYQRLGQELVILFEAAIITTVYIYSIIPGLDLWQSLVGGSVLVFVVIMLFLYWNYNRLLRNEKR